MSNLGEIRELAFSVIESFEDLLHRKNISIPSPDREGNPEEARIYGYEYYELEDQITLTIAKALAELIHPDGPDTPADLAKVQAEIATCLQVENP